MQIVTIPYTNDRVWHGSSRSDQMFVRDAVVNWHEENEIQPFIYTSAYAPDMADEHGIFLFADDRHAVLFKLTWA